MKKRSFLLFVICILAICFISPVTNVVFADGGVGEIGSIPEAIDVFNAKIEEADSLLSTAVEGLVHGNYIEGSKEILQNEIASLSEGIESKTLSEICEAIDNLTSAITTFATSIVQVNTTELSEEIALAKAYRDNNIPENLIADKDSLNEAIENAEEMVASETRTQALVDGLLSALNEEKARVQAKVNKINEFNEAKTSAIELTEELFSANVANLLVVKEEYLLELEEISEGIETKDVNEIAQAIADIDEAKDAFNINKIVAIKQDLKDMMDSLIEYANDLPYYYNNEKENLTSAVSGAVDLYNDNDATMPNIQMKKEALFGILCSAQTIVNEKNSVLEDYNEVKNSAIAVTSLSTSSNTINVNNLIASYLSSLNDISENVEIKEVTEINHVIASIEDAMTSFNEGQVPAIKEDLKAMIETAKGYSNSLTAVYVLNQKSYLNNAIGSAEEVHKSASETNFSTIYSVLESLSNELNLIKGQVKTQTLNKFYEVKNSVIAVINKLASKKTINTQKLIKNYLSRIETISTGIEDKSTEEINVAMATLTSALSEFEIEKQDAIEKDKMLSQEANKMLIVYIGVGSLITSSIIIASVIMIKQVKRKKKGIA